MDYATLSMHYAIAEHYANRAAGEQFSNPQLAVSDLQRAVQALRDAESLETVEPTIH